MKIKYINDEGENIELFDLLDRCSASAFPCYSGLIGNFRTIMHNITVLCNVEEFNPVLTIKKNVYGFVGYNREFLEDEYITDYDVIFDIELDHVLHITAECYHINMTELFYGFYNIFRNIKDIQKSYLKSMIDDPICDAQKIELLARNIAHYLNGRIYESMEGSICKCEMIERKFINHGRSQKPEIQKHIFDRYCYSFIPHETVDNELQEMCFHERFFDYGGYNVVKQVKEI